MAADLAIPVVINTYVMMGYKCGMAIQITPEQLKAARALVGLDQAAVAQAARVSVVTVKRAEAPEGFKRVGRGSLGQIRQALENAGIEFMADGVRRHRKARCEDEQRYADLIAMSDEIADLIQGDDPLTDHVLYDVNGLPV